VFQLMIRLDRKMRDVYQWEDEVFRLMSYISDRSKGIEKAVAAQNAIDRFLNYDIRAPWPNMLRRSILPFMSYTYAFVPVMMKAVAQRPWKIAKIATLGLVLQELSYALVPGDEEEERAVMHERDTGWTWVGLPKLLRLPFTSDGDPVFLGMTRVIPGGGLIDTDTNPLGLPEWMMISGPLLTAAEFALNKVGYTGQEIFDEVDTGVEKAQKGSTYLWRAMMPNAPWIPGSWNWHLLERSIVGHTDIFGRTYSPMIAFARQAGPRLYPHNVDTQRAYRMMQIEDDLRHVGQKIWQIKTDFSRNRMSEREFKASMARRTKQLLDLGERAQALR